MTTSGLATPPRAPSRDAAFASRKARLLFVIRFAAIVGVWSLAYAFPYPEGSIVERGLKAHLETIASIAGSLIKHLLDPYVRVNGQDIVGRYAIRIVKDCDAMDVTILLTSAVLAFPGPWRRRIVAVAAGAVLIFALNQLRICSLYYIGLRFPNAFELTHREIWPLVMVIAAASAFWVWASGRFQTWPAHVDA